MHKHVCTDIGVNRKGIRQAHRLQQEPFRKPPGGEGQARLSALRLEDLMPWPRARFLPGLGARHGMEDV
jgi:hypothetical protein